jgi:cytochrome P450
MTLLAPPSPSPEGGLAALRGLITTRSVMPALSAFQADLGSIFQLSWPGFQAAVLSGPEANHFVYVEARQSLRWRSRNDPVIELLRNGLLMLDGAEHDEMRHTILPYLQRSRLGVYSHSMMKATEQVCRSWQPEQSVDMLVEMRRLALLILMDTLFDVDMTPDLERLFPAILRTLSYISPGAWLVWRKIPRPGYQWALKELDAYFYQLIAARRQRGAGNDLLSHLIEVGLPDDLIRDQVMTLFIAGHDTSTALLAWTFYLLGKHPPVMQRVEDEILEALGNQPPTIEDLPRLPFLEQVMFESLRMFPPIHIGNRFVAEHLAFNGYEIKEGWRVMLSIYLGHRDEKHWPCPAQFQPERFAPGVKHAPYAYVPFGGGPRNCIGAAFTQVEARLVLARLLQRFKFTLLRPEVKIYMGATLEPRPGVFMQVMPRR